MAQPNGPTGMITGSVEAVNERGVKVAGAWYNVSQYRPVPLPTRGATVVLEVRGKWLERCTVVEEQDLAPHGARSVTRERTITRLAVLKAAAAFAASRPDAKSCDVPRVAEAWLRWVLAEEGGAEGVPVA